jgi:hypothetical protein
MSWVQKLVPGVLGLGLVLLHVFGLPRWLEAFSRPSLVVELDKFSPRAPEGEPSFSFSLPPGLRERVSFSVDGSPAVWPVSLEAGAHRLDWSVLYRGGFLRKVGVTLLVGPSPSWVEPPCSLRLRVARSLLDDGSQGPHTIAGLVARQVEAQMRGQKVPLLGQFSKVERLRLQWLRVSSGVDVLVVQLGLSFEAGRVPVGLVFLPQVVEGRLRLLRKASAQVKAEGWFERIAVAVVGGDSMATKIAQEQVDLGATLLEDALAVPPPFEVPGGPRLTLRYCGKTPLAVVGGDVVVSLALDAWKSPAPLAPVLLPSVAVAPAGEAPLSLEVDLNALNGVLHTLWVSGFLDREIERAGLVGWFQRDERVQRFLSLRLASLSLALPPMVQADAAGKLWLWLEAALALEDKGQTIPARVFSTFGLGLESGEEPARLVVSPGDLALTCEPVPGRLEPCYADLFAEVQKRRAELAKPLQEMLQGFLQRLLANLRIEGPGVRFVVEETRAAWVSAPGGGVARLSVFGSLE